jgi:thiamine kinase-like enzyme
VVAPAPDVLLGEVMRRLGWHERADVITQPLDGGITNLNYKVLVGDRAFVVRLPGKDSERLGIDRRREHACSVAAHACGVAPEVVAFFDDLGVLVTRFLVGHLVAGEAMHDAGMLRRVADALRRYHGGAAFPGTFWPFQVVRDYTAFSAPRGAPLPERFDWMMAQAGRLEGALGGPAALGAAGVPRSCHNDLLLANFLDDGARLWIIDWEYAAMGDPFFDLGNFAVHHQLTDAEERVLLDAYLGRATPSAVARLKLMKAISDLREAMWAMVQVTISDLDYDFVGYGRKHFDRYTAQVSDPRLSQWLEAAARA